VTWTVQARERAVSGSEPGARAPLLRPGERGGNASVRRALQLGLAAALACSAASCSKPPPPTTVFLPAPVTAPPPQPAPRGVCLQLEASPRVNLYEGEAHAVVVYLFPLRSSDAFQDAEPAELLSGADVPGQSGPSADWTLLPGEVREIREPVQDGTERLGLIADFSRGPRRVLLQVGCGREGRPRIVRLLSGEIEIEATRR
jgi:type VI secretion system VasD/TssJ family lipoprotein